jgi:broad specificity phosphatase PhoE
MSEHRFEVVLVRHGETEWSRAGKHTGGTDVPLTDAGRQQARALGAAISDRSFVRVLTSPLDRALTTCRLAGYGERAEVVEELREWDYGDFEGQTTVAIRERVPGWTVWTHGVIGGESIDDVARRADSVIEMLRDANGDVALFGHGHALRILAARWCEWEPIAGGCLMLDTATVSILGYEREMRGIRLWNEAAHLRER